MKTPTGVEFEVDGDKLWLLVTGELGMAKVRVLLTVTDLWCMLDELCDFFWQKRIDEVTAEIDGVTDDKD